MAIAFCKTFDTEKSNRNQACAIQTIASLNRVKPGVLRYVN